MADIHGEIDRWKTMLEQIHFSNEDTIYVLGDVIDRKPYGIEILQDIMSRPNVHMIMGNHEQMMLNCLGPNNSYYARRLWTMNEGDQTYRTMVYTIPKAERLRILSFVQNLPDHLEIEVNGQQYYLVHGYPGPTTAQRLWDRPEPPPSKPLIPGKIVICGHTCTYWLNRYVEGYDEDAPFKIFYAPGLIDIDCGCGSMTEQRRLACLRLDDMKEFYI